MIFDTHAHYDDRRFDEDREEVLASLKDAGVLRVVNVAADMESVETTLALAKSHENIYAALGIHPDGIGDEEVPERLTEADMEHIRELVLQDRVTSKKVVAIGEIGLDYHWDTPARELQKKWFMRQLELAQDVKLPVVVHSRDAAKDTYDALRAFGARENAGIIHCFSYEKEMARQFLDLGYSIALGGAVTFKNARAPKEVAAYVPADRLLLETDCPYMAPVPHRGERNSSAFLPFVAEVIAEVRGVSYEAVCETTWKNANTLFGISE